MFRGHLARWGLGNFICAFFMAVAHATGFEELNNDTARLFVVDIEGSQQAQIAWQGASADDSHGVSLNNMTTQTWHDGLWHT